jgi:hypothetical protein
MRIPILTAALLLGAAVAGEPARRETPLVKAKRLASSKSKQDRILALRTFKALGRPGNRRGDDALFLYAELCLRFHEEGEPGCLDESRRAFALLASKGGSRYALRGKLGGYRVAAAEGKRDEAIKGLDRFLSQQTKCERAVEAAYYIGMLFASKPGDLGELRKAQKSWAYALDLHSAVSKYHPPVVSAKAIRDRLSWVKRRIWELNAGRLKVLFTRAEKLRKAKKYDAAGKLFAEIHAEFRGHDFGEQAGLRVAQCRFWRGDLGPIQRTSWSDRSSP